LVGVKEGRRENGGEMKRSGERSDQDGEKGRGKWVGNG